MRIAFYVPHLHKNKGSDNFVVETFVKLIGQQPDHTFIIITTVKDLSPDTPFPPNTEVIIIKPPPKHSLLKKLWANVKMKATLDKVKAGVLLVFENDSPITTKFAQCLVIRGSKKIKAASIKNAHSVIVMNSVAKEDLIKKNQVSSGNIFVLYPYPDKIFKPEEDEKKENIKKEYSEGTEFFLCNNVPDRKEDLVNLLKSFSHFKKRQQSNFKLLLLAQSNPIFEEALSNYRYRNDVKFIYLKSMNDEAMITAAAYAVLLPFNANEDMLEALNAMQAGVPVIVASDSIVTELVTKEYAETDVIKDIGENMIRLYTNEDHRAELIRKGKTIAAAFTPERSAELLWKSVMNALV